MATKSQLAAIAAAAALGVAFSGSLHAQGMPGMDVDVSANLDMGRYDKNADKKISKAEAASNKDLNKQFGKLDADKDGNLDEAEFAKFEAKGSAKAGDGAPGKDEGDPATTTNRPGTTDDSTPGNEDKLGPGR